MVATAEIKPSSGLSSENKRGRTYTQLFWLGNVLAVLSTWFYSGFIVINQRRLAKGIERQEAWLKTRKSDEKHLNPLVKKQPAFAMVLAFSGLLFLAICWMPLPILHKTGVEPMPCEIYFDPHYCANFTGPSIRVWGGLTVSALVSTATGELLWMTGCRLTSSLLVRSFCHRICSCCAAVARLNERQALLRPAERENPEKEFNIASWDPVGAGFKAIYHKIRA
ncbi:hypothetical protein Ciccas_011422 [Cichlidogyrus casuarinus]|uniref:Uncharacterized protein n=1 Tax=Cichlidogyrus casuarinus TaxID=1844966 RepID=A0ABD2PRB3_9PLAT